MQAVQQLKHGDFTQLAEMYSRYRPGYSPTVLKAILGIVNKAPQEIQFADVGAGTGIWTRMVARAVKSAIAVEPNVEMRKMGMANSENHKIHWQEGDGENTNLASESIDLLSMASSFHWVNFELGMKEFHRVLRDKGCFVALWNPRHIDDNPLLVEIEKKIYELAPHIKRVSSGKSHFVDELSKRFKNVDGFEDLTYLEGQHTAELTPEEYIGAWNSVNDVRAQMGESTFNQFMDFVASKVQKEKIVSCTYMTRAWVVRKK